jgi:hypothetical protein
MIKIPKRCSICNSNSVVYVQNKQGYCGTSSEFGYFNVFGYCNKKNVESPELIKHRRKHGA